MFTCLYYAAKWSQKGQGPCAAVQLPHAPPVSPRLPLVADGMQECVGGEVGLEPELSEHQQVALQQEERVLAEQIESLQKEKEELTFEMLTLEARASDDETLDSEASIGTAGSSENLNVDSEGATSDFSERGPARSAASRPKRTEGKINRRHNLRRQPDSQDTVDSCSTVSASQINPSSSAVTARRYRYRYKSPSVDSATGTQGLPLTQPTRRDSADCPSSAEQDWLFEERSEFTSRGTFNPEKGKQKLKGSKPSPLRHTRDSGGHSSDPPDLPQQLVLYGNNEFMV
ncbi:hypothetical protein UPYG_G00090160 [Umbra pygmaea]|uniref:Uncharacterized protein n=1 Tax=Umbra pygmaea TaxID=75934 RepID=A0ABD0XFM1_UMBPY